MNFINKYILRTETQIDSRIAENRSLTFNEGAKSILGIGTEILAPTLIPELTLYKRLKVI